LAIVPLIMKGPTTVLTHRGLSPHQFTPMSGAHQPDAQNAAMAVRFHFGRQWRGVCDPGVGFVTLLSMAQLRAGPLTLWIGPLRRISHAYNRNQTPVLSLC
jgi:hypothetical protein